MIDLKTGKTVFMFKKVMLILWELISTIHSNFASISMKSFEKHPSHIVTKITASQRILFITLFLNYSVLLKH